MKFSYIILLSFLIQITIAPANSEMDKLERKGRLRKGRRPKRNQLDVFEKKGIDAVTINYPTQIFKKYDDWRSIAKFNAEFFNLIESDASWKEQSKAQDQEDIWLYENWFYGMTSGIIMESGALDGYLFSTSYFFEHVANWTAIHVGNLILSLF